MRIVTWNIQWAKGRDGRIDLDRIAAVVAGADVIALQEVERHWRKQDYPDQAARLGELLPGYDWVHAPAVDLSGGIGRPRRQMGLMLLSRFPILSTRTLPLPAWPVPGEINDDQILQETVIEAGPVALRLYNVHLNYVSSPQRLEQLGKALTFITSAPAYGATITSGGRDSLGPHDEWIVLPDGKFPIMPQPAILLGDFNMTPQSEEYRLLTTQHGFADALALSGMAADEGITFPSQHGYPPLRLDHIFLSPELVNHNVTAWIDNDTEASDHQPVWLKLKTSETA